MALNCAKLATGVIGADCANPLVMGVKPIATIINHDDIDLDATTVANGVITKLVLKSGTKAFKAETLEGGINANIAFAKGAYYNGWEQNFVLRLFDNSPQVKQFVEGLSKARVVIVVENKYVKYNPASPEVKGETVYEAYGFFTGLRLNEATRDSTDGDTKGGYVLTCGCDENAKEPTLPLTVFDTSLTITETMINTLSL